MVSVPRIHLWQVKSSFFFFLFFARVDFWEPRMRKNGRNRSWRKLVEVSALCFLRIDSAQRMDVFCHWYPDTQGVFPVALLQTENASCLKKKVSDRLKKKRWKMVGTFWALRRRRSTGNLKGDEALQISVREISKKVRFYRDLNSDRWIQSPEC